MPNKIVIQFKNAILNWVFLDDHGKSQLTPNQGKLAELLPLLKNHEIYILAPAKDVLLTEFRLPKLSKIKLMKALSFALEDIIIDDITQVHIAIGKVQHDATIPTAVVSKSKMDYWTKSLSSLLNEKTQFNKMLFLETLALPLNPKGWTVLVDGTQSIVRLGPFTGFEIALKYLWTLLRLFLSKPGNAKPETIQIIGDFLVPETELDFFKKNNIRLELKAAVDQLILMAESLNNESNIDLLQGEYRIKSMSNLTSKLHLSRFVMLGIWLAILTFGSLIQVSILESKKSRLNRELRSSYEKTRPQIPYNAANLEVSMKKELQTLRVNNSGPVFLSWMADLSPIVSELKGIKLLSLEFENKVLTLELDAVSFSDIDQLIEKLKLKSFKIEHRDETKTESLIRARLIITRKEPTNES